MSVDSLSDVIDLWASRWSKLAKKLLLAGVVVAVLTGALMVTTTWGTEITEESTPQRVPRLPEDYRHPDEEVVQFAAFK